MADQSQKKKKYVGALVSQDIHEMLAKTKAREDRSQAAIIKRALRKYCEEVLPGYQLHELEEIRETDDLHRPI